MTRLHHRSSEGFSVIEAMVALLAGLIVIGAVLAFTVASVRSSTENVQATRLQQELRTVVDFVTRELRRAGYDDDAISFVGEGAGSPPSPFSRMQVVRAGDPSSCVVYAYDRAGGTPGVLDVANGEVRAVRRVSLADGTGAVEFNDGAAGVPDCDSGAGDYTVYPPACSADGWCPVTDPRIFDVTQFRVTIDRPEPAVTISDPIQIREVELWVQGRLAADPDVVRGIDARVRVRSDCVRTNLDECELAPGV